MNDNGPMSKRDFFDEHAPEWDSPQRAPSDESLRRVIREADIRPDHRVLDVGTGTGILIPLIVEAVGTGGRILALDVSAQMLMQVQTTRHPGHTTRVQADVHHLPVPSAALDRVICNAAFPHFDDRELALREMVRALRSGGALIVSHPIGREAVNARHRAAGGPVGRDRVPAPEEMEALLRAAALTRISVTDEPEFYLARGWKP